MAEAATGKVTPEHNLKEFSSHWNQEFGLFLSGLNSPVNLSAEQTHDQAFTLVCQSSPGDVLVCSGLRHERGGPWLINVLDRQTMWHTILDFQP